MEHLRLMKELWQAQGGVGGGGGEGGSYLYLFLGRFSIDVEKKKGMTTVYVVSTPLSRHAQNFPSLILVCPYDVDLDRNDSCSF